MKYISNRIDNSITVAANSVNSNTQLIDLLSFKQYKIVLFGINVNLWRLPGDNPDQSQSFDESFVFSITPFAVQALGTPGTFNSLPSIQNIYYSRFYHFNDDRFKNEDIMFAEPIIFEINEHHYFNQIYFNYNTASAQTFNSRGIVTFYLDIYENWIQQQKNMFKQLLETVNNKLENIDYKVNSILLK
jgi:hypothetical protein